MKKSILLLVLVAFGAGAMENKEATPQNSLKTIVASATLESSFFMQTHEGKPFFLLRGILTFHSPHENLEFKLGVDFPDGQSQEWVEGRVWPSPFGPEVQEIALDLVAQHLVINHDGFVPKLFQQLEIHEDGLLHYRGSKKGESYFCEKTVPLLKKLYAHAQKLESKSLGKPLGEDKK